MDAEAWDARYEGTELIWKADPNQFLVAQLAEAELDRGVALDLACGEGRNAVWLAEQGWKVTAVDFSGVALDKARHLATERGVSERIEFVEADVRAFVPTPAHFDLVIVFYLHLPASDRRVVVQRGAEAIVPGGTFLMVGHDRTNITDGYGGPQDPAILTDADEIADDLSDVDGIVLDEAGRVTRVVSTDDGERTAIDTLVRAHLSG